MSVYRSKLTKQGAAVLEGFPDRLGISISISIRKQMVPKSDFLFRNDYHGFAKWQPLMRVGIKEQLVQLPAEMDTKEDERKESRRGWPLLLQLLLRLLGPSALYVLRQLGRSPTLVARIFHAC